MDFAPVYLLQRLVYRFVNFFHHWYVDGSRAIGHRFVSMLESADQTFALKVTLKYFWRPLYGDYTVIGRILGIIFRTCRIIVALVIYLMVAAFFLAFYLAWLILPAFALFYTIYYGKQYGF